MSSKDKSAKSEAEWKERLDPLEYHVTREAGTERAFTGRYWDEKRPGQYRCVCCGELLFDANTKYDSGSGWPSFYAPVSDNVVSTRQDESHGMVRTEITCSQCDSHLGHVFPDGPPPTGLRYCLNSVSLKFEPGGIPSGEESNE